MERVVKAFKEAKKGYLTNIILLIVVSYFLYYSIVEYSLVSIIICSIVLIFIIYILWEKYRYNRKLVLYCRNAETSPDEVRIELMVLLEKMDKKNARFGVSSKDSPYGSIAIKAQKEERVIKRNKIAKIISELNIYIKNNIK